MLDTMIIFMMLQSHSMIHKHKSSEQRFGHVNATNRNSYLNIIFIKLVTQ